MPKENRGHGGGYVFDCRCLPNPGRNIEFKTSKGLDATVVAYLSKEDGGRPLGARPFSLDRPGRRGLRPPQLHGPFVAFGCTGGQHRSVYLAERLAKHLRDQGVSVVVTHRENEGLAQEMKALILAAGAVRACPSRMRRPRPCSPSAACRCSSAPLRRLKEAGVKLFVVNAHHHAQKVVDFCAEALPPTRRARVGVARR